MKRFSYSERDYAFGQAMLTLRTAIGLTQAGLAELLGVSRKAISRWEAGDTYPKAEHLKALLAFAIRQQAFAARREEEEIRAFWCAARQKVLLDERWLQELLGQQHPRLTLLVPQHVEERSSALQIMAQSVPEPRVDWSDALAVPSFYGRAGELAMLTQWVIEEHCRVVSVLGLGGIGKTALAVSLMHQVAPRFEVVILAFLARCSRLRNAAR
jgi:transcriptional regulator with XRE-family HTH domain